VVDRRAFLLGLTGGLLLRPAPVRAQAARRPPRIGWLTSSVVHQPNVEAFRQGMLALDHRAIGIEFRAAEGQFDRLAGLAAENAVHVLLRTHDQPDTRRHRARQGAELDAARLCIGGAKKRA